MKRNSVLKIFLLILPILLMVYIILCGVLFSFSISVSMCFVFASGILLMFYYTLTEPINEEEMPPSFYYIFIKVSFVMYFFAMIFMICFNILYPKTVIDKNKNYDYIIVFGAGISDGRNEIMNSRIDKAVEYSKKYPDCKFILTGAKGDKEPIEEAYYMQNYMKKRGMSDYKIIVEPFSTNTHENIKNSIEVIKKDILRKEKSKEYKLLVKNNDLNFLNIGFMSSEFHLTRISLMAKKQGIKKPYMIDCFTFPFYAPYMYVRENLSLFKAFALGQF